MVLKYDVLLVNLAVLHSLQAVAVLALIAVRLALRMSAVVGATVQPMPVQ
jgi:hypothetical protein